MAIFIFILILIYILKVKNYNNLVISLSHLIQYTILTQHFTKF